MPANVHGCKKKTLFHENTEEKAKNASRSFCLYVVTFTNLSNILLLAYLYS